MIRTRILSDRVLSMNERYSNGHYNNVTFKELWGQYPREIRILKGPECVSRPRPFSHRVEISTENEPELENDLEEVLDNLELNA